MKLTVEAEEKLYAQAVEEGRWYILTPSSRLLLRWQYTHPQDVKKIAELSSHRNGNHEYCDTDEKCEKIKRFIEKWSNPQQEMEL